MSDYPGGIDSFRTQENLPNIEFDPDKPTIIYAEDFTARSDAIIAIEETLGINPQGAAASVSARIAAIESGGGGGSPLTTKGDLFTHGETEDARLPVGTDSSILIADSLSDNGLVWGAPGAIGIYTEGGTDVAVADGGTGASTAAGARTNLGLAIGTDVQANLGFTPENVANKSSDANLGESTDIYPTQFAVKGYVDNNLLSLETDLEAYVDAAAGTGWHDFSTSIANLSLGNGTLIAKCIETADECRGFVHIVLGTTSSITGSPLIALPYAAHALYATYSNKMPVGQGLAIDGGATKGIGFVRINSADQMEMVIGTTAGSYVGAAVLSASVPFGFGAGDTLSYTFSYLRAEP